MASKPDALDCQAILSQMGWLRALARGLGADRHQAEDLTQATFLTALEHPPETSRPVRGWLRTVMRNLLAESRRSRLRREARETRAARPEASEAAVDVVARAAVQKRVVDAVMALDEPYRTSVLLRFFEDLPPRKIASRMGVPVATVKTRLSRALEQLRGRLDREHGGDRRAWLFCLLAPLPKAAIPASTIGVIIVQTKAKLAAAAILLVGVIGVGGWYAFDWGRSDAPAKPPVVEPASETAKAQAKADVDRGGAIVPVEYKPYADVAPKETAAPGAASLLRADSSPAVTRIRGRVLDAASTPVGSVRVVFKTKGKPGPEPPPAMSGPDGSFEMESPGTNGMLSVEDPRYATVLVGAFDAQATAIEPIIIIAPLRRVAGHVVDKDRRPLSGVEVRIDLPDSFRAGFDRILDYSESGYWGVKTGADGRFALESAPTVKGASLSAHLEGYEGRVEPLSSSSGDDVEIVMARTSPVRDTVTGKVVDHDGVGIPGARVSTSYRTTTTDDQGAFTIKFDPNLPLSQLIALKDGLLPGFAELSEKEPPQSPVVLRLEGAPLSIAGKVVDGESKPLAGIAVWVADPTLFANSREGGMEIVENLLSGATKRYFWLPVQTDEAGRFAIRGLLPRDYRLNAMDKKTLALAEAGPLAAGTTDVVVTLSNDEVFETVAGVVVSRAGNPVPNVSVHPQRDAFHMSTSKSGGGSTSHADTDGAMTDANGRFTLHRLPKKGVYLRLDGSDILPLEVGRSDGLEAATRGQKLDQLRIEVSARCHFQVDLGDEPELADQVSVLDARGREIPVETFLGNGRKTQDRGVIKNGRTDVLAVPETAAVVILLKNGKEVDRKHVRLMPGSVTIVKP